MQGIKVLTTLTYNVRSEVNHPQETLNKGIIPAPSTVAANNKKLGGSIVKKPQAARSVAQGSHSHVAVSRGQHRFSSPQSQQVPDSEVAPVPACTTGYLERSSVTGTRIYPTRPSSPGAASNRGNETDYFYASLVLITVYILCKLFSKFQAPWTLSLFSLVQAILPFFTSSTIPVPHHD